MDVAFDDDRLKRLETEVAFDAGYLSVVVKAFRKRMQIIRSAADERDFLNMRSLNFEKLKGDRCHQHSMRLNDQWRLVVSVRGMAPNRIVVVNGIEGYRR